MKLGAERNKVVVLVVTTVVAAGTIYIQFLKNEVAMPTQQRASTKVGNLTPPRAFPQEHSSTSVRRIERENSNQSLDPMTVDPTLRTELLTKVRSVEFAGVERNLFRFAEQKMLSPLLTAEEIRRSQERLSHLREQKRRETKSSPVIQRPAVPPINWKYYGFANSRRDARKRAFLLNGEEIFVATEGDIFKKRYRIVRIGINSITIEDMRFSQKQRLSLEER